MAPLISTLFQKHSVPVTLDYHGLSTRQATTSRPTTGDWRAGATADDFILESWSQGVVVGALMIMGCITVANMRRGVLLHKLILAELLLAMSHGTFAFMSFHGYGWYLSSTAMLLYFSWIIHNVVAWLKVRPFFSQPGGFFKPSLGTWTKRVYLGTLALSIPVIVFQISNNFRFFNNRGGWYKAMRPYEPLMRDPWWVFTCVALFYIIQKSYGTGTLELLRRSPRFGILLAAIFLSIVFTACDIAASISSTAIGGQTEGINPWWKLSLVSKCLTDTIMLDDFKTELKRLGIKRIAKEEKRRNTISLVDDYDDDDDIKRSSGSRDRKSSRWFRNGSLAQTSTAGDISPTTSIQKTNGVPNGHVGTKTKALNNPDADIDELEFSTALFLDPSQLSGVESTRSDSHRHQENNRQLNQRDSITNHTKHLSRLPSLKQWSFEPIKPGRAPATKNTGSGGDHPTHTASASSKDATGNDTIQPLGPETNQATRKPKGSPQRELEDDDAPAISGGGANEVGESTTSRERLQRFKQSIGA